MKSTTSVLDGGANFSGIHRFYFFEVLVIVNDFFDGFDDGGAPVSFTGKLRLKRNDGRLWDDVFRQEQYEKSVAGKAASAQMVAAVKQTTNPNQGEPVLKKRLKLKKEVLIVNNAQGAIMDTRAVVDACNSGHIAGLLALLNQYNDIAALQVQM
ncbi:Formate dehydrogenase 2, mitochondrial [Capsicum chinense]|nr:Formate dehydrogenase 2, mitochondrial [Capsicum chinense]